jgi:hypothetical protein
MVQIQQSQVQDFQQSLHMVAGLALPHQHQLMVVLGQEIMVVLAAVVVEIKLAQELQSLAERVCIQEVHSSVQHDKVMMAEAELV